MKSLMLSLIFASVAHSEPLSHFMPPVRAAPESVVYKRSGSQELKLHIFRPSGVPSGERRPALICIHGGAWLAGGAEVFFPHAAYFASRGLVGISIEYRLLQREPAGFSMADCLMDCKSAIRYIRTHAAELGVDLVRIGVMGDSAGGHLAAALGTCAGFDDAADNVAVNAIPNSMILCNPIMDLTEAPWVNYIIRGRALERKPESADLIPTAAQIDLAKKLSPIYQINGDQPPALLIHGLKDAVVTPDQARKFAAATQKAGNRCDLELLPEAGHAFILTGYRASEPDVVAVLLRIDRFLAELGWLNGPANLTISNPPAWPSKIAP